MDKVDEFKATMRSGLNRETARKLIYANPGMTFHDFTFNMTAALFELIHERQRRMEIIEAVTITLIIAAFFMWR